MKGKNKEIMYFALVSIFFIISNIIVKYSFAIGGTTVYYSVFTFPLVFLFILILFKKYGFVKAIYSMIIAIVLQCLAFLIEWLITKDINLSVCASTFISAIPAELIMIGLYKVFNDKKLGNNTLIVFLTLTIAILIDNFLFLLTLSEFDKTQIVSAMFNYSNLIKIVMALICSFVFKKLAK